GEQGLFGGVMPLPDAGAVAVHQAGQQYLVQAADQLVLERRPELFILQVGIHPGKRAGHRSDLLNVGRDSRTAGQVTFSGYTVSGGFGSRGWCTILAGAGAAHLAGGVSTRTAPVEVPTSTCRVPALLGVL